MICSASHVVIMLVERYPDYFIVNLDKVRNFVISSKIRKNRHLANKSLLLLASDNESCACLKSRMAVGEVSCCSLKTI